jgi:hypothetical protein
MAEPSARFEPPGAPRYPQQNPGSYPAPHHGFAPSHHEHWVPPPSYGPPAVHAHGFEPSAIPDIHAERQHGYGMPPGGPPQWGRVRDVYGAMPEVAQGYMRRNSAMGQPGLRASMDPNMLMQSRQFAPGPSRFAQGGPGPQFGGPSPMGSPHAPFSMPPHMQQRPGTPQGGDMGPYAPNPWLTSVQMHDKPQRQARASLYGQGAGGNWNGGMGQQQQQQQQQHQRNGGGDDPMTPLSQKLASLANLAGMDAGAGLGAGQPGAQQGGNAYNGPRANNAYDFSVGSMNQAVNSPLPPPLPKIPRGPQQQEQQQQQQQHLGSQPGTPTQAQQQPGLIPLGPAGPGQMSLVPLSPIGQQPQLVMLPQPSPMLMPMGPMLMGPMGPVMLQPLGQQQQQQQQQAQQQAQQQQDDLLSGLMQGLNMQQQQRHMQPGEPTPQAAPHAPHHAHRLPTPQPRTCRPPLTPTSHPLPLSCTEPAAPPPARSPPPPPPADLPALTREEKCHIIFQCFDTDHDGHLSLNEMAELVRAVNPDVAFSQDDLAAIIDNVWSAYSAYVSDRVRAARRGLAASSGAGLARRAWRLRQARCCGVLERWGRGLGGRAASGGPVHTHLHHHRLPTRRASASWACKLPTTTARATWSATFCCAGTGSGWRGCG